MEACVLPQSGYARGDPRAFPASAIWLVHNAVGVGPSRRQIYRDLDCLIGKR